MSQPDADHRAAAAVVAHHTQLAADLARHAAHLREAATTGENPAQHKTPAPAAPPAGAGQDPAGPWRHHQRALLSWLRGELLPHAAAEESALYPAAAAQPAGRLLIDGMLAEHRVITALVGELDSAGTAVDAAAAARALSAVFEAHLAKENDLVLPLLLAANQVSLASLLDGMHDLLGAGEGPGDAATGGGCGGAGGGCGCGGQEGRADAPAPALTVDARLDVRSVPHHQRHAQVLAALDALLPDSALVLVAPHAPRPLLAEIAARYPGQIDTRWLQEGPDVWQIRLHRQPSSATSPHPSPSS